MEVDMVVDAVNVAREVMLQAQQRRPVMMTAMQFTSINLELGIVS